MGEQLMYLPVDPYTGPEPCPACAGAKVSGTRYRWAGDGPALIVDEVCDECGGCGRAQHTACGRLEHSDRDDWYYDEDDDDSDGEWDDHGGPCPSCQGVRWWPAQGFDAERVTYLRMPCGCAEALMVPATT
jgi:hypothetical protein